MKYSNSPTRYAAQLIDIVADENSSARISLEAGVKLANLFERHLGTTAVRRYDVIPQTILERADFEITAAKKLFESNDSKELEYLTTKRASVIKVIRDLKDWDDQGKSQAPNFKALVSEGESGVCDGLDSFLKRPTQLHNWQKRPNS